MTTFVVHGGKKIHGEVAVYGSKNAVTKLMVASLLTEEPCIIENVPFSGDFEITKELCEEIGSKIRCDTADRSCVIHTPEVLHPRVPELSRRNRIPILALGPLLHRRGVAEVPVLGGCPIGHRPINFHIEALVKMGARIERREHSYFAEVDRLHGAAVVFSFPSVGATENVLLAAVRAEGKTTIQNAAVEPEIMNLVRMLEAMGARILVDGAARLIEIEGVPKLSGVRIRTVFDRNEAVSFASVALATDGDIFVRGAIAADLAPFLSVVDEVGAHAEVAKEGIRFWGKRPYRALRLETGPHPGFMTDWQQPLGVLLTQAEGESIIHETVYEDRFGYTKDLRKMGAHIEVTDECLGVSCRFHGHTLNHSIKISGPTKLRGTNMVMTDIRAGMAHLIAALVAEGESAISGVAHVDRGYEKIDERLRAVGADIKRM